MDENFHVCLGILSNQKKVEIGQFDAKIHVSDKEKNVYEGPISVYDTEILQSVH